MRDRRLQDAGRQARSITILHLGFTTDGGPVEFTGPFVFLLLSSHFFFPRAGDLNAANRFNGFTDYGIGIGLRAPHYNHILTRKPVVDWFEIISENFMIDGGRPLQILDQILEQYKVVQHGVSMYFGSAEKLNREHLRRLKELVKRTNTPWLSDHLCWGSVDGRYTHDLLPMPYTFEAARLTAQKV